MLCSIKILLSKSRGRKKKEPDRDFGPFPTEPPIMLMPYLEEESGSTPSPEEDAQPKHPLKMKFFDVEAYKKSVIPIELQRKKMASETKVKPDVRSEADAGYIFSEDDHDDTSGSLSNISIKKEPEDADIVPENEHVTGQKTGFNPKICPKTLKVQEDLPPQQCQICKKTFHNIYLLQIHLDNNHFQCDICKRILERHQMIWHKQYQVECTECKKVFCTRADQYNHWSEKHAKFHKCDACNLTFETEAMLESHKSQSHVCAICLEVFCTKYKYQKHYGTHVLTCPQCPCSFHNQKQLDRHMERHNYMECDVCGKKVKGRARLKIHKEQVHSETSMPCDVCGKQYKGIKSLEQHKITIHGAEGRYKCDICGKQYLEKPRYEQHMRIHTGEKPYQCTICGKAFPLSSSLYVHTKKHNTDQSYSCTICGATYRNKYYLKSHMNRHDPSKAVTCQICLKTFKAKELLRIHSEIHKNERRHKCELCGTAYNNAGSLWTHKKKHRDRNEMP